MYSPQLLPPLLPQLLPGYDVVAELVTQPQRLQRSARRCEVVGRGQPLGATQVYNPKAILHCAAFGPSASERVKPAPLTNSAP